MVTALYRRYRPETFGEMIGQSQVTEPLMTALRTNRVNHAYLFSGPRGCGKTTSARILARCLNCAEGPTDTPCGVCPSCVELSRDGSGSLDVVEIDAASHNGVDDARDLRERAVFAPARDRYKIFILDEAHMVTPQGFNALLKIVEEPPEHIKFIFATTEPDKVIGTIRSRTHHYPFRLIPPAQLLEYVSALCEIEGVAVAPGVLPLVVRAGGGSARDTLSLLDQLIAGSESNRIEYERAVALLGYTHASLLGEVIDALGDHDAAAAFGAVDRVIQTGQDPRRFVEDLLERLRDVIIVAASNSAEGAAAVLRGMPSDDILQMQQQAALFGSAELSRTADIVNAALTEMTGATSPRLHLELMIARVLVPASDDSARGALARVERLERRVGVGQNTVGQNAVGQNTPVEADARAGAAREFGTGGAGAGGAGAAAGAGAGALTVSVASSTSAVSSSSGVAAPAPASPSAPAVAQSDANDSSSAPAAPSSSSAPTTAAETSSVAGPPTAQLLRDAWPEILEAVQKAKRGAWMVVYTATVRALEGDVLTLSFPSENDVASFKQQQAPGQGVSEYLRRAIVDVIGLRVKFIARVDASGSTSSSGPSSSGPSSSGSGPAGSGASGSGLAGSGASGSGLAGSGPSGSGLASSGASRSGTASSAPSSSAPGAPQTATSTSGTAPATPAPASAPSAAAAPAGVSAPGADATALAPAAAVSSTPAPTALAPSAAVSSTPAPTALAPSAAVPSTPAPAAAVPSTPAPAVAVPSTPAPTAPARTAPAPQRSASSRPAPGSRAAAPAGTATSATSAPSKSPATAATASPTVSWPTVAIPTSAPEPGDEPVPVGAIPVRIPAARVSAAPASAQRADFDAPADLPDDIPESVPDFAAAADGWYSPSDDVPLDDGPTDFDPSDFRRVNLGDPNATGTSGASSSGRASEVSASTEPRASGAAASAGSAPQRATPPNTATRSASSAPAAPATNTTPAASSAPPARPAPTRPVPQFGEKQRYGEAVVREILGASFVEERPVAPRAAPGAGPGREG
ncbi:DNA polymerase III subunit gamma and tau [Subtercola endophyticus]|uniref:DNA polymerase III subunit gamma and tau n=1 Tax=Subtercola endophyticus TaxID=2895559 RepID=UPI0028BDB194|nr:DNA polymerase III subunit gamma and tau [Subtercola endophyticus]